MDGVLTDYEKMFEKISGGMTPDDYDNQHSVKDSDNPSFFLTQNASPDFYANQDWMPDGKQLYDFVKNFDSELLSHAARLTPDDLRSVTGKEQWIEKHGIKLHANLVPNRSDKAKFANENSILIDDRKDNVTDFINAGGIGILHKNATDTINKLKDIMGIEGNEIKDKQIVYNSILNPDIWEQVDGSPKIKQNVLETLLNVAKKFFAETELDASIHDIILVGSSVGYNWTPDSDIDLHIVIDFSDIDENEELVKDLVDKHKNNWNEKHDIKIKNHEVEVYIQDIKEENKSESSFSVLKNEWIKKPTYKVPNINKKAIKYKYKKLKDKIESLVENPDEKSLLKILRELYDMRQTGLDRNGEYSTENLVFKILRKRGYMDMIRDCIVSITDKELSIKQ